ncbi:MULTISPECIES: hypothetical protein [unclassified Sphingomonas]|uniref:hypothetical protein n=1 Tax=unclassified Sphingomonas TaxID=196159 RepID=UPI0022B3CAEB|nr:hypothetical protein [Sphingomonas sp. NIBR02145]WHU03024.1 hypothetical protein O3305_23065 [Sphingomonas sp. NIBR02145]
MIATVLLAAALQTAPIDWDALPPLPWRAPPIITAEMQTFVQREVKLRKCVLAKPGVAEVSIAVLVDEGGNIRTTVPRAIACPSVEQYAAALAAGFARNNLLPRPGATEQWYRTTISFTLTK